jgi:hypothetical protein
MSWFIVLAAALVVVAAANLILVLRLIRRLRAVKEEGLEFRRRWRELEPGRRRAIKRAVRRGQAVSDPQEARLALKAIENGERVFAALRPFQLLYPSTFAAVLVLALVEQTRFVAVGVAVLGALFAFTWLSHWQRMRKLRASAAAMKGRA